MKTFEDRGYCKVDVDREMLKHKYEAVRQSLLAIDLTSRFLGPRFIEQKWAAAKESNRSASPADDVDRSMVEQVCLIKGVVKVWLID